MRKTFILSLLLFLIAGYSDARQHTSVEGIRYASYKSHTRVVIDLDGPVEFSENHLKNPSRIYFDLVNCVISRRTKSQVSISNTALNTVRMAQFDRNTVRVVFDVNSVKNYYAFTLEKPFRLVVDVYPGSNKQPDERSGREKKEFLVDRKISRTKTVVIDAGHGGKDPGAIGPRGIKEKNVTLHVAKRLGHILKRKYGLDVIYTRDRDVFVPLNERTEIANSSRADLFVSIHVNASRNRRTRGIETYFLNWTNNREALKVAARENRVSIRKMQQMRDSLQMILQDLARKNKNDESMRLAYSVQSSMVNNLKRKYSRIQNLGVKYALFYVLVGAEMPSVLVEVSFISNHEEERRLASKLYREKIAEAIAMGINSYINESSLIVEPAAQEARERGG
jgi:N-acetylmuramoyl-L-alanine amidase